MLDTWRRHLVVHSAHKTVGVSLAPIDAQADRESVGEEPCPVEPQTRRVCLITAPADDQAAFSAEILAQYLDSVHPGPFGQICCQTMGNWASSGNLAECHCAVLFLDRQLPAAWLAAIAHYARCGGGLIGLRAADTDWLRPMAEGCDLFGAECLGRHASSRKPVVRMAETATFHPTVAGVRPFVAGGELVKTRMLNAEAVLVGSVSGTSDTVAWTCRCEAGRGFCTTLGHPADFRQSSFLRLLANAVSWTCEDGSGL